MISSTLGIIVAITPQPECSRLYLAWCHTVCQSAHGCGCQDADTSPEPAGTHCHGAVAKVPTHFHQPGRGEDTKHKDKRRRVGG